MGLSSKFRCPDVRNPDLDRPESLSAKLLAVLTHPLTCRRHTGMLHETESPTRAFRSSILNRSWPGWRVVGEGVLAGPLRSHSASHSAVLRLVERFYHATWVLNQVEYAARPSSPPRRIFSFGECCGGRKRAPEIDRQPVGQGCPEVVAQGRTRRGRPHESTEPARRGRNCLARAFESRDGVSDPAFVPRVGEWDGDLLDFGDGISP